MCPDLDTPRQNNNMCRYRTMRRPRYHISQNNKQITEVEMQQSSHTASAAINN